MNILFSILIIIASLLLILVVLMQKSKGGGLSSSFSSSNSILGYKKTTDVIEKVTWILATVLIVLCIATVSIDNRSQHSIGVEPVQQEQQVPTMNEDLSQPQQQPLSDGGLTPEENAQ